MTTLTAHVTEIKNSNQKFWVTTQKIAGITYTYIDTNCVSFCSKCFCDTSWVEVFAGENYSHDKCSSCGGAC